MQTANLMMEISLPLFKRYSLFMFFIFYIALLLLYLAFQFSLIFSFFFNHEDFYPLPNENAHEFF